MYFSYQVARGSSQKFHKVAQTRGLSFSLSHTHTHNIKVHKRLIIYDKIHNDLRQVYEHFIIYDKIVLRQDSRCHAQSCVFWHTFAHTATHCNTLLHNTTQCNTLQHTTTHCSHSITLQHTANTAIHCNTLQRTVTHRNTLQHTATHCNTMQRNGLFGKKELVC